MGVTKHQNHSGLLSPIDKAKRHEVIWQNVSPVFEQMRGIGSPSYVYFVGEGEGGPIKIGVAKDPVKRVRGMQTGNSRRLRIEYVLVGDAATEKLLHQMWSEYAIYSLDAKGNPDTGPGTEWFRSEIREPLIPILETAVDKQLDVLSGDQGDVYLTELESAIRQAHGEHGFVAKQPHQVRVLGSVAGYVTPRASRI